MEKSFANLASGAISLIGGLLSLAILSRTWTSSDFGCWAFANALTTTALALDCGLILYAGSLSREKSNEIDHNNEINKILILSFIVAIVISSCLFVSSNWLARFINDDAKIYIVSDAIRRSAFGLCGAKMLCVVGCRILTSQNRYYEVAVISAGQTLTILGINLLTSWSKLDLVANIGYLSMAMAGWMLATMLMIKFQHLRRRKYLDPFCGPIKLYGLGNTFKKSLTLFISSFSSACFTGLDKLIVSSAVGPQGLAIYTVSASVANQINSISSLIIHPVIHFISSSGSRAKLAKFANLSILTGPTLSFVCVLFSPTIRSVFFPRLAVQSQILLADQSISIMCLIYGIYSVNCYGYYELIARNKLMAVSAIVMTASVLSIASMTFLGDKLGLLGLVMCNGGYILTCSMTVASLQGMYRRFAPAILLSVLLSITSILCIVLRNS